MEEAAAFISGLLLQGWLEQQASTPRQLQASGANTAL